ncbi:hypothetical protein MKX01_031294 [Papaver californicum]|nr:hypothetical protein MKX01_031294 [Papaver californicum]
MYQEEVRRYEQAKLGRSMNYATARRLEQGQFSYKVDYRKWSKDIPEEEEEGYIPEQEEEGYAEKSPTPPVSYKDKLLLETQNSEITKLTDGTLRYSVEGEEKKTSSGTLEAHAKGFLCTISSPIIQIELTYKNLKHVFFRSEDVEMLPLLNSHLYTPINVEGGPEVNDIQFQLVKTLVSRKRDADDSDKIEKEKDYNENFQKFVEKAQAKWDLHLLTFELPQKKYEFHGSSGVFALTTFCLAGIVKAPFFVVTLTEIEFVNLAHLRNGEIDMTIVLKDFTRDVFQINSIPSTSVTAIKGWFDMLKVKYYENKKEHDWNDILNDIRKNPKGFIEKGCWG